MNKLTVEASINIYWEAFKAKIQMSSAMGDTIWTAKKISVKTIFWVSLLYVIDKLFRRNILFPNFFHNLSIIDLFDKNALSIKKYFLLSLSGITK